jgi:hypothetical protein
VHSLALFRPKGGRLLTLVASCVASVLLYLLIFGFVVSRPLVVGEVGDLMDYKLAYARETQGPKIFVLAGSNARFSHSCAVIEELLHRPCVNGGIAYGIGLDWLLDSFQPYIHAGDIVYLPLEYGQYSVGRTAMITGVDAAYRFRYEKKGLLARGPDGIVRAAFMYDLPTLLHSIAEMTLKSFGVKRRVGIDSLDKQGDEVGHDDQQAKPYEAFVNALAFEPPNPTTLMANPEGQQAVLSAFLDWCKAHQVIALGGLPTMFDDRRIDDRIVALLRDFYASHGAGFVELENRSQYPRHDFFDTAVHLREAAQIIHSKRIADSLANIIDHDRQLPNRSERPD